MHGNAIEWCRDVYSPDFYQLPEAKGPDPVHEGSPPGTLAEKRVLRGGGFDGQMSYCRSADRYAEFPALENAHRTFGVRPSRPALQPATSTTPTTDSRQPENLRRQPPSFQRPQNLPVEMIGR